MMQQTVSSAPVPGEAERVAGIPSEVRVIAIPADHPYVRSATSATGIAVLPDPRSSAGWDEQWWPPAALDPGWIRSHASDADLLHIHFGTESFTPGHLSACLWAAREVGWPVVFTLHDLQHPQLDGQERYLAQLDVLVAGADALITLTEGAAEEIRRRWRRSAIVLRHPAVLPPGTRLPAVLGSTQTRIGMHLKDLRPNVDAEAMTTALAGSLDHLAERGHRAVAEVRMHHEVRDRSSREAVRRIAEHTPRMMLIEHERLDDRELEIALSRLDVCVLPYRHGTHSGWLELCWDLAVPVVAPRLGYYAEQHDDGSVATFGPNGSAGSLAAAILAVIDRPGTTRAGSDERIEEVERRRALRRLEDAATASVHAALYRRLISERRS